MLEKQFQSKTRSELVFNLCDQNFWLEQIINETALAPFALEHINQAERTIEIKLNVLP